MEEQRPLHAGVLPSAGNGPTGGGMHGATAVGVAASSDRRGRNRILAAGLLGVLGVTVVSAVFIACFIGGLHAPGPRSVPVGLVGSPAQASRVSAALGHQAPGAFTISSYPTVAAARNAIGGRTIDAALVPGSTVQHLLVASAVSEAETNAMLKAFHAGAAPCSPPAWSPGTSSSAASAQS